METKPKPTIGSDVLTPSRLGGAAEKKLPDSRKRVFRTVYDKYPQIDLQRERTNYADIKEQFFWDTLDKCKAYSLLGVEAFYNLYRSAEYIAQNSIPGDFVECGVFLGGGILAMSDFAYHFGLQNRRFFLYDSFVGFPPNTAPETDLYGNRVEFVDYESVLEAVSSLVARSLCPKQQFVFVQGIVEETLKRTKPEQICLLQLDTDYYESTRVELHELYPRLSPRGVLIVEDYGYFQGAARATDEFFTTQTRRPLLMRVNFSVRAGIKPD